MNLIFFKGGILEKILTKEKIQILIILVFTFLAFSNSLSNKIVWDDHYFIEGWKDIRSFNNIPNILTGSYPEGQGKVYRPLRGIFWMVDYKLWGQNPFFYHLQAILIHLGATVTVYFIAYLIFKKRWIAFAVSLLFGLHSIHTETIDYISSSLETYGSLFFLLSFYFYLKKTQTNKNTSRKYSIVSIIFATFAFFTYEMTLTLPILIILYDICFRKKYFWKLNLKQKMWIYWPYFLSASALVFIRVGILHILSRTDYLGYSFYLTMLVMLKVFMRYILLLFAPINLTANHNLVGGFSTTHLVYDNLDPILKQSIFDPEVIFAIVIMLFLLCLAVVFYKKHQIFSFGILWFYISLLPVSYIIPGGGAMAEKYLYIPSFGFIILIIYCLVNLKNYLPKWGKYMVVLIFIAYSLFLFTLTYQRNQIWHDDISLFSDMDKKLPGNIKANFSLGYWYQQGGSYSKSIYFYQKVLKKAPNMWEAHLNLSRIYQAIGKKELYESEYEKAQLLNRSLPLEFNSNINLSNTFIFPNGSSFLYPNFFSLIKQDEKVVLKDKTSNFTIEIIYHTLLEQISAQQFLNNQTTSYGSLVNQGLAKASNVEYAFVKVWQQKDSSKLLQFFLFSQNKVLEARVFPASSSLMPIFDQIVESIRL
jgi:tetratricopeptide (TPR) repeat protein